MPVLILDANQRSALAATRSLGTKGIHVVVANETEKTLAGTSKYCRESLVYPSPYENPEAFIATLKKDCVEHAIKVIFPMTEITTSLVLKHRHEFKEVTLPFVSFETFDGLTDKWKLFELAQKLDIPTPTTYFVSANQDLRQIYPRLQFPVVLKPYRTRSWSHGCWIQASVKYASSVQELKNRVAEHEYLNQHPFLIQEYIRGQGQGIFTVYDRSQPVASGGYKIGVKNRWLLGDCAQLYILLLGNETSPPLTFAEKSRALVQFLNFFEGNTRYEVNRWNDLSPFLFELKHYSGSKTPKPQ